MFQQASVWDIPLVKPRFGCSTNLALAAEGYDVAHELNRYGSARTCHCHFIAIRCVAQHAKRQEKTRWLGTLRL